MIPRGAPDIGWLDLIYGLASCCSWETAASAAKRAAAAFGGEEGTLPCLSVRSGLDLFLQAVALPAGSEILVSAITIPDIPRIVRHHQLIPVPLDIDRPTLSMDVGCLEAQVSLRTRAILIAHLFGSRVSIANTLAWARARGIVVIEDCAQAYDGAFCGDPASDVRMFSFGPIKTATALGGAILQVADPNIRTRMRELSAQQDRQGRGSFAQRCVLMAALKVLAQPSVFTAFVGCCGVLRVDYDAALSKAVRGFSGADLIRQIRRTPSVPLLRLLARRLGNFNRDTVRRRQERAEALLTLLSSSRRLGIAAGEHSHWVLPIYSSNVEGLIRFLRGRGFDATHRASSLQAVAARANEPQETPHCANDILSRLLFLPTHPRLTERAARRLAGAIEEFEHATEASGPGDQGRNVCNENPAKC